MSEFTAKPESFPPLLDFLAAEKRMEAIDWQGWQITPIEGGANNLLYRVQGSEGAFAVKFCIRDERDRAGREFQALSLLQQTGKKIAPLPILLERDRYPQPVVVQSWLEGVPQQTPPVTDADWMGLLTHFADIHTIVPQPSPIKLLPAVLNMRSAAEGKAEIRKHWELLPPQVQPAELSNLVQQVEAISFPNWAELPTVLCHGDANIRNRIRQAGLWASVDWEYSGWGDGAFEIADLLTHPAYEGMSSKRRESLITAYAAIRKDDTAARRIAVYYLLLYVWWTVRWARYCYEIPLGRSNRLAAPPPDWESYAAFRYNQHLHAAQQALDSWKEI